jgi:hypothetical protein
LGRNQKKAISFLSSVKGKATTWKREERKGKKEKLNKYIPILSISQHRHRNLYLQKGHKGKESR